MQSAIYGDGTSKFEAVGFDSTTTSGTALTSNATPGSDGAWTQLVAATANDWHAFHLFIHFGSSTLGQGIIDVGIGAASSEVIVVPDVPYEHGASNERGHSSHLWLPVYIAKGSRVAARIHRSPQASHVTKIMLVGETMPTRTLPPFQRATMYGTDLASARGTSVDPGAVQHTLGSNTELAASTTNPIRALYVIGMKVDGAVVAADTTTSLEVYVGAGGSEVVLIPEFLLYDLDSTADLSQRVGSGIGPLSVNLPSASRLSCKARCSSTTAGAREAQVSILALD